LFRFAARGEHLRAAKIGRFSERGRLFLVDFSRVPAAEMIFEKESKNARSRKNENSRSDENKKRRRFDNLAQENPQSLQKLDLQANNCLLEI
jgi:hypothetical protein